MSVGRRPWSPAASIVLAVALIGGRPAAAAVGPETEEPAQSEVERLYYDGSAKYSASDYDGAIDAFTRALAAATRDGCDWQRDCMPGHYCLAGVSFNCPTNDCCAPFCSTTDSPDPCTVHGANFECRSGSANGTNAPGNTGLGEYVP